MQQKRATVPHLGWPSRVSITRRRLHIRAWPALGFRPLAEALRAALGAPHQNTPTNSSWTEAQLEKNSFCKGSGRLCSGRCWQPVLTMPAALHSIVKFTIQVRGGSSSQRFPRAHAWGVSDAQRMRAQRTRAGRRPANQASDIASADWCSKSDPMCVLLEEGPDGEWTERARTESIQVC